MAQRVPKPAKRKPVDETGRDDDSHAETVDTSAPTGQPAQRAAQKKPLQQKQQQQLPAEAQRKRPTLTLAQHASPRVSVSHSAPAPSPAPDGDVSPRTEKAPSNEIRPPSTGAVAPPVPNHTEPPAQHLTPPRPIRQQGGEPRVQSGPPETTVQYPSHVVKTVLDDVSAICARVETKLREAFGREAELSAGRADKQHVAPELAPGVWKHVFAEGAATRPRTWGEVCTRQYAVAFSRELDELTVFLSDRLGLTVAAIVFMPAFTAAVRALPVHEPDPLSGLLSILHSQSVPGGSSRAGESIVSIITNPYGSAPLQRAHPIRAPSFEEIGLCGSRMFGFHIDVAHGCVRPNTWLHPGAREAYVSACVDLVASGAVPPRAVAANHDNVLKELIAALHCFAASYARCVTRGTAKAQTAVDIGALASLAREDVCSAVSAYQSKGRAVSKELDKIAGGGDLVAFSNVQKSLAVSGRLAALDTASKQGQGAEGTPIDDAGVAIKTTSDAVAKAVCALRRLRIRALYSLLRTRTATAFGAALSIIDGMSRGSSLVADFATTTMMAADKAIALAHTEAGFSDVINNGGSDDTGNAGGSAAAKHRDGTELAEALDCLTNKCHPLTIDDKVISEIRGACTLSDTERSNAKRIWEVIYSKLEAAVRSVTDRYVVTDAMMDAPFGAGGAEWLADSMKAACINAFREAQRDIASTMQRCYE